MEKSAAQWMVEQLRKYATFSGRARRTEFWWFQLLYSLINIELIFVDMAIFRSDRMLEYGIYPLAFVFGIGVLLPSLAVSFRRLHDLDRSAWWTLIELIPIIGVIVLLVLSAQPGTVGENRFGADPIAP